MRYLASRIFEMSDQHWFGGVSGDWNPIHVDPIAARRTLAGEPVVHGMHGLIWALDQLLSEEPLLSVAHLSVVFSSPIFLGRSVDLKCDAEPDKRRLQITEGEHVLFTAICTLGPTPSVALPALTEVLPRSEAEVHLFEDLKGSVGSLSIAVSDDQLCNRYKNAISLGAMRMVALASLSRLVGMKAPGLHSLFSGLDVTLTADAQQELNYSVTRHKSPRQPIKMAVTGGGLAGTVSAFYRPPSSEQPSYFDVQAVVAPDEFVKQTALIVGGSRGLGEVTTKAIAAGGGTPVLTYFQGVDDATRIAAEIEKGGGQCDVAKLDVRNIEDSWSDEMGDLRRFTHIYYFATPHIGKESTDPFDLKLFDLFKAYYVDAFFRICEKCTKHGPVVAFYPSTIFLDEPPKEAAEYVAAKAAGEAMAHHLDRHWSKLNVLVQRLPRLDTDQNLSIMGKRPEPLLDHVLTFVRAMERA